MRSARLTTTQPAEWIQAWKDQAEAEGFNLSEWIGSCCNACLPKKVAKALPDRPGLGRGFSSDGG